LLDDLDLDIPDDLEDPEIDPPPRRSFVTIAGILGAILVLALIAIGIYSLVILPQQQAAEVEEIAAETSTALALAAAITDTPTASATPSSSPSSTSTSVPSSTSVPTNTSEPTSVASFTPSAVSNTEEASATMGPNQGVTQTVQNLLTQATQAQTEAVATLAATVTGATSPATPTPSALPDTGFADDIGVPTLILSAALLLLVILLTRRLRRTLS
jgi:hypothetical protein